MIEVQCLVGVGDDFDGVFGCYWFFGVDNVVQGNVVDVFYDDVG